MGREIDALVAEKVMGWTVARGKLNGYDLMEDEYAIGFPPATEVIPNVTIPCEIEPYSTDIRAAWDVVNKMLTGGWEPNIDYDIDRKRWECIMGHMAYTAGYADAETAPHAICLAVLKAVGIEVTP